MNGSAKTSNAQPWSSKFQPKTFEKSSTPVTNTQSREENARVSTPIIRQNFPNSSSINHTNSPNVTQKSQPVPTATIPKISAVVIPGTFRSINEKQENNTTTKGSSLTNSPLIRPVGVKQDTVLTTPKSSSISAATVLRPVGAKQETITTPKSSSVTIPTAFRPVRPKTDTSATSSHTPNLTATAFRPPFAKQETPTSQKKPPVMTSSTSHSASNAKQEPTQKSVKDLVGKFNDK